MGRLSDRFAGEIRIGGILEAWEQAFDDPQVTAAVRAIVEPANEQNLDRWQAEVANAAV